MNRFKHFLKAVCVGVAVVIGAHTSKGIDYGGDYWVLFIAVCFLSLFNLVLKPLLVLFALPFIVVTLGFGLWVINALLFMLVGAIVPGFEVVSFWSALWGAFLVSVAALVFDLYVGVGSVRAQIRNPAVGEREQVEKKKSLDDDIIDI